MSFFMNCKSLAEAKKEYREFAMEFHPDHGGNAEMFKALQADYETFLENFVQSAGSAFQEEKGWSPDMTPFSDVLKKVMNFNCRIEIIGIWIYAFESFEVKDHLKEAGFWFSKKHSAWIFSGTKKRNVRTGLTTDDVRYIHGSEKVRDRENRTAIA